LLRKLREKLEQNSSKYDSEIQDYREGKLLFYAVTHWKFIVKETVKKLTVELTRKQKDIDEQNKLNLKFSEMIEHQNKKLSKFSLHNFRNQWERNEIK